MTIDFKTVTTRDGLFVRYKHGGWSRPFSALAPDQPTPQVGACLEPFCNWFDWYLDSGNTRNWCQVRHWLQASPGTSLVVKASLAPTVQRHVFGVSMRWSLLLTLGLHVTVHDCSPFSAAAFFCRCAHQKSFLNSWLCSVFLSSWMELYAVDKQKWVPIHFFKAVKKTFTGLQHWATAQKTVLSSKCKVSLLTLFRSWLHGCDLKTKYRRESRIFKLCIKNPQQTKSLSNRLEKQMPSVLIYTFFLNFQFG